MERSVSTGSLERERIIALPNVRCPILEPEYSMMMMTTTTTTMHPNKWGRLFALLWSALLLPHPPSITTPAAATTTTTTAAATELPRASCLDALTYADQDHDELLTRNEFWEAMHQIATLLACTALQNADQAEIAIDNTFDELVCSCLTMLPDHTVGEKNDPLCCPAGDGNMNSKLRLPSSSSSSSSSSSEYPDMYADYLCQSMVQVLQDECRRPNAIYEPLPPPVEVSSLLDVGDVTGNNNTNDNYYNKEGEEQDDEIPAAPSDTSSSLGAAEKEEEEKSTGERVIGSPSTSSSLIRLVTSIAVTLGVFLLIMGLVCVVYRRRQRIEQEQVEQESENMKNTQFGTAETRGSAVDVTFVTTTSNE